MRDNLRIFGFAAIVCITCSFLLSVAALGLKERQQINIALDKQRNILLAVGIPDNPDDFLTAEEVANRYEQHLKGIVIDGEGNAVEGKTPLDLDPKEDTDELAVYLFEEGGSIQGYVVPIIGKGLWSTLYGYLALEPDCDTVLGITYYKHGETPGLGAEISKAWFQDNFKGKKVLGPDGDIKSIRVIKGKVDQVITDEAEKPYVVDGISGATITSKGVTAMLLKWLNEYDPFFAKKRQVYKENTQ